MPKLNYVTSRFKSCFWLIQENNPLDVWYQICIFLMTDKRLKSQKQLFSMASRFLHSNDVFFAKTRKRKTFRLLSKISTETQNVVEKPAKKMNGRVILIMVILDERKVTCLPSRGQQTNRCTGLAAKTVEQ